MKRSKVLRFLNANSTASLQSLLASMSFPACFCRPLPTAIAHQKAATDLSAAATSSDRSLSSRNVGGRRRVSLPSPNQHIQVARVVPVCPCASAPACLSARARVQLRARVRSAGPSLSGLGRIAKNLTECFLRRRDCPLVHCKHAGAHWFTVNKQGLTGSL